MAKNLFLSKNKARPSLCLGLAVNNMKWENSAEVRYKLTGNCATSFVIEDNVFWSLEGGRFTWENVKMALTRASRTEKQLAAPRSGALGRVGADVEDVVGGRAQSVDDDARVGGVGRPVVGRVAPVVVQQLIEHDLAVAVALGRRVPLQSHAGRTCAARREVVWRAGRNYAHVHRQRHANFS